MTLVRRALVAGVALLLRAHTHHGPVAGSACVGCHMPKKNMGLAYELSRYHRIEKTVNELVGASGGSPIVSIVSPCLVPSIALAFPAESGRGGSPRTTMRAR